MPRFALDTESVPRPARAQALLDAVNHRVVVADGAMGTMLQGRDLSLEEDFQGLEGCNEILNDTRPDVLADIHDAYFATGIDAVETNTFGANWSNLSDYGIGATCCREKGPVPHEGAVPHLAYPSSGASGIGNSTQLSSLVVVLRPDQ